LWGVLSTKDEKYQEAKEIIGAEPRGETAWADKRSISFADNVSIKLSVKTHDLDNYHKITLLKNGKILLEYGGDVMNYILLQYSNVLLDGRYILFNETINIRSEGGALMPSTSHRGAIDIKEMKAIKNFISAEDDSVNEYFGVDVDPGGRFVLLAYLIDDPDFPQIRVFDNKEKIFIDFNSSALTGYQMEEVRWNNSTKRIEFGLFATDKIERAVLDWDKKSILEINNETADQ